MFFLYKIKYKIMVRFFHINYLKKNICYNFMLFFWCFFLLCFFFSVVVSLDFEVIYQCILCSQQCRFDAPRISDANFSFPISFRFCLLILTAFLLFLSLFLTFPHGLSLHLLFKMLGPFTLFLSVFLSLFRSLFAPALVQVLPLVDREPLWWSVGVRWLLQTFVVAENDLVLILQSLTLM